MKSSRRGLLAGLAAAVPALLSLDMFEKRVMAEAGVKSPTDIVAATPVECWVVMRKQYKHEPEPDDDFGWAWSPQGEEPVAVCWTKEAAELEMAKLWRPWLAEHFTFNAFWQYPTVPLRGRDDKMAALLAWIRLVLASDPKDEDDSVLREFNDLISDRDEHGGDWLGYVSNEDDIEESIQDIIGETPLEDFLPVIATHCPLQTFWVEVRRPPEKEKPDAPRKRKSPDRKTDRELPG